MEIILCVLLVACLVLLLISIFLIVKSKQSTELSQKDKKDIIDSLNSSLNVINNSLATTQSLGNDNIVKSVKNFQDNMSGNQQALEKRVMSLIEQLYNRLDNLSKLQENKLEQIRETTEKQMRTLQEDNNKQLDKMRETVDEKLSRTINERFDQSFKMLSKQLEEVYKSLGEMQSVASDVGNLTKVLSNVKTTGIFGEIQLGAILDQLLTSEQYEQNVVTADAKDPVEYAIKLPGQADGEFVYLPIDSKFPLTIYSDLYAAYEKNDFEGVKQKRDLLKTRIKAMAKDIQTKYIYPPKTTNFAVMFLPTEGLFAEVAKMGLIEELQRTYNVTVAGPTTMSALLNSLQMGFKTLAIQKKSGEVWKILSAVKTEFGKFNDIVGKIQTNFEKTSKDFDTLVGTRSRMIESKLKSVEKLNGVESAPLLNLSSQEEEEE